MSTHLKSITGRFANGRKRDFVPIYDESEISLTRFAGGKKNGAMLQVTISNNRESAYTQLTRKQAAKLLDALTYAFDYEVNPSE